MTYAELSGLRYTECLFVPSGLVCVCPMLVRRHYVTLFYQVYGGGGGGGGGCGLFFFFQAEDGIRDLVRSRGLGDVYKRQRLWLGSRHEGLGTVWGAGRCGD